MNVVEIQEDQLNDFVSLCERQHRSSELRQYNFDADKLRWYGEMSIADEVYKVFLAIDENDLPVGYIIAGNYEMFFGKDMQCGVLAIYVRPESRSFIAARSLIRAAENWAYERGALCIDIGDMGGGVDGRYIKFLEKIGYQPKSYSCVKEIA